METAESSTHTSFTAHTSYTNARSTEITDHFWQYAIVDLEAFKAHAKLTAGYKVACSKIVPGNSLKLDDTQGPVAKFSKAVTKELALTKVEA